MRETIIRQFTARENGIDERQARGGTVAHRHRHRAVQFDHRGRLKLRKQIIQADDLRPVGCGAAGRLRMHRRNRRLQAIRTRPALRQRAHDERNTLGDLLAVPAPPILLVQKDQFARGRAARRAPRFMQQHQREQAHRLGLGQKFDQQPRQADRLPGEILPRQRFARRSGVALVEHQVDHAQHARQPLRQFLRRRHPIGNSGVAYLRLRAHDALRHGRRCGEERVRDLLGAESAHLAQRERHLCVG